MNAYYHIIILLGLTIIVGVYGTSKEWQAKALAEHNKHRKNHGAEDLTLDPKLSGISQDWANHLANSGAFEHNSKNKGKDIGENLYMAKGSGLPPEPKPSSAIQAWYDEKKDYTGTYSSKTGHFTQLVWKGSKTLGCSFAKKDDRQVVVCNYSPAGNIEGKFKENVQAQGLGMSFNSSNNFLLLCPALIIYSNYLM